MNQPQMTDFHQPGTRLSPALIVERVLGQGGMGTVVLAQDELLDRRVAVKILDQMNDVETAALRTLLEARAAARVVHPHVVAVHGIGDIAGTPFIEMEYVDGGSLRFHLRRDPPSRPQTAIWLAELAAALTTAHEAGVVHCDVKPENVLIRQRGNLAKLADFGLARSQRDGRAHEPLSHGTVAYLAPELQDDPPSPQSDQFALAVMAVEMLAGSRPLRTTPTSPCLLPPDLEVPERAREVLHKALHPDPQQRFASTALFVDALLRGLRLAHLRGPLIGLRDVDPAETSRTSSELPVPLLVHALAPLPLDNQIAAILALLPSGYPGALPVALGTMPPTEALQHLRDRGMVDGQGEDVRWKNGMSREPILKTLTPKQRRLVCAGIATALETVGQKRESTREDATRLYLAARRLKDAARLARESAFAAKTALARDHHLARQVALLTSQTAPLPWLEALTERIEWLLTCGWLLTARGPLAEAQGLLADAALAPHDPLRLRLTMAAALLRSATGDPQGAMQAFARVIQQTPVEIPLDLRLKLLATQGMLQLAAGRSAHALETVWPSLTTLPGANPELDDAELAARTEILLVASEAALALKRPEQAKHLLNQALARAEELGDGLMCARALLLLVQVGVNVQTNLQQVAQLLQPLGATEWTGRWHLAAAEQHLQTQNWLPALQETERAAMTFQFLGLHRHDKTVVKLRAELETQIQAAFDSGQGSSRMSSH